jgi:hypothetical protein
MCHVSVGHVARLLEAAGIPTVMIGIRAFRRTMRAMTLPRVLVTPHFMGRTLGAPCDAEGQRRSLRRALDLLEEADSVGTIVELEGTYRPVGCGQ